MHGWRYEPWELKSSLLGGRADSLRSAADDTEMPLTDDERTALRTMADKLKAEAREVVRRG